MAHAYHADPRRKIDSAAVAPRQTRRYRAAAFQTYVILAAGAFVTLALAARTIAYFPLDLTITRFIQQYHGQLVARLMYGVSWIGFVPQIDFVVCSVVGLLYLGGLRWEAVATAFAAAGSLIGTVIKLIIQRPRPTADLIHVFQKLPESGFPSGHVLEATVFVGFLAFLAFTLLKTSIERTVVLAVLGVFILLMGISRIYQGQHWFSDVMGAYLLGSLWLALTVKVYRWGKSRFFVDQPVASNPAGEAA